MCKFTDEVYDKAARSLFHTDPALWTKFKVNVMKWACSVGHRACLTAARNFAQKMLRNESSSSSYVFSGVIISRLLAHTFRTKYDRRRIYLSIIDTHSASTLIEYRKIVFSDLNVRSGNCTRDSCVRSKNVVDDRTKLIRWTSVTEKFRTWTYCTLVKAATVEQWLALLKRYDESAEPDKRSLAYALGCHSDENLLRRWSKWNEKMFSIPKCLLMLEQTVGKWSHDCWFVNKKERSKKEIYAAVT